MINLFFVTAIVSLATGISYLLPFNQLQTVLSVATACFAFASVLVMIEPDE